MAVEAVIEPIVRHAKSDLGLAIASFGVGLPTTLVANELVAERSGTTASWIESRTGMIERVVCGDGDTTASLAALAGGQALLGVPADPQMIILATTTPDRVVPATAVDVQARLGLSGCPAFDINSACSGFLYGLAVAMGARASGLADNVLLIGADTFTKHVDVTDSKTAPLFGDGAAAVMLTPCPEGAGVLSVDLWADGEMQWYAHVPGSTTGSGARDRKFVMDGRAVKDVVLERLPVLLMAALQKHGLVLDDVDRFIVHQANPNLVKMLADRLGVDAKRMPTPGSRTGNTAAASIPLALAQSSRQSPIDAGAVVALLAAGAGMSAGVAIIRWV